MRNQLPVITQEDIGFSAVQIEMNDEQTRKALVLLCKTYGLSKAAVIRQLVNADALRLQMTMATIGANEHAA